ncbi:MAG: hypothetical protein ACK6DX_23165 [Acidobacteriota bacterium]
MKRRAFLFSTLIPAAAQDWRHSAAFHRLYNLDFEAAIPLLEKDCAQSPADPHHHNNLAYAILYRALFAADALDGAVALSISSYLNRPPVPFSPSERARFSTALARAEQAAHARGQSTDSLYALGVSQTHRANLALLIDKHWRTALRTAGEARKLHARALSLDSRLLDAQLVPSFHEYVLGSLPFFIKALGFLVGFSGEKAKGIDGLRAVAQYGFRAKLEAQVLLALVERREQHPERAVAIMHTLAQEFPSNHLYRREVANLLLAAKRPEEARREFAQLSEPRYCFLKPARLQIYRQEFEALLHA